MNKAILSQTILRTLEQQKNFMRMLTDPNARDRFEDPLACDFTLGDPQEMPLSGFVTALERQVVPQDKAWYAYKMSEPESRQAIVDDLQDWRKVRYDPEDIHLTSGAFGALAACLRILIDPGDEVIFISPPWFFYEGMIALDGGVPVRVLADRNTFDLDLDAIQAAITRRTRAIIINSPNNPTGKIYPAETLQGLSRLLLGAESLTGRPIILISDESYSRIVYDGRPFTSPTRFYPHSFLVYTFGKTLLAPGQRIGYIAVNPEMVDREAFRQAFMLTQFLAGYLFPNALLQHALPDLLKLSIDIRHLQGKRDRLVGALREMGYTVHSPEGTFYMLPRSPIPDDRAFTQLLAEEHIYCLPGLAMEMAGFFRLSLTANDSMIERALPGFAAALQKVRKTVLTGMD